MQSKYIMRNSEVEEAQAGIKITKRNINNLRYADDTTLMAESEEDIWQNQYNIVKLKNKKKKTGARNQYNTVKQLILN